MKDMDKELIEKYPNENITDLMRIFAREYPFYKSESSLLFGVLKVIKNVWKESWKIFYR